MAGGAARRRPHARRHDAARVLQRAGRDARHDHGLPGRRAAGRRRLREFRRAAADRRTGHGVPAPQHDELLGLLRGRHDHAGELLRPGWCGAVGLDVLLAARRPRRHGTNDLDHRNDLPDHLVAPRRHQFYHDDHPAAGQGAELLPLPLLRVGPARDLVPAAPRLSAAGGGRDSAADGPGCRDELLPAERAGGERPAARGQRRRQPAPLAAPVLVPGAPRSLCAHPARHGHRRRGHRQQHAQAPVGLPQHGVLGDLPRVHVLRRVGASHVHDRHGHDDLRILPD